MGATITIEVDGMPAAMRAIEGFSNLPKGELLEVLGALVEMQTRRRIEEEKTSPEGADWAPNRAGTSILLETGRHLRDSIGYVVSGDQVEIGAAWEFAHVHQGGATIKPKDANRLVFRVGNHVIFAKEVTIPARPFMGVSSDNEQELVEAVESWLGSLLQ